MEDKEFEEQFFKVMDRGLIAEYLAIRAEAKIMESQLLKVVGKKGIKRLDKMVDGLLDVSGVSSPEKDEDKATEGGE